MRGFTLRDAVRRTLTLPSPLRRERRPLGDRGFGFSHARCGTQRAVRKNTRPQTATAFQKFLGTGSDRAIHPVAWLAFLRPVKTHSLDFEILIDQIVEIDAARNDVSSRQRRRAIPHFERAAKFIKHVE